MRGRVERGIAGSEPPGKIFVSPLFELRIPRTSWIRREASSRFLAIAQKVACVGGSRDAPATPFSASREAIVRPLSA